MAKRERAHRRHAIDDEGTATGDSTIMISPTDSTWRAVRLRDEEGVAYLRRLLKNGWYLMRIDADGLPYLGFEVPINPPPPARSREAAVDRFVVIVLRRGTRRDLQRAFILHRDDTGHFDLGSVPFKRVTWRHVALIAAEDGSRVVIVERIWDE